MHASAAIAQDRAATAATAADTLLAAFAEAAADDPARPKLREQAIEAWLPLSQHLARRYAGRGEPVDDLVQVAVVGLIKAIDRYDPHRGIGFTALAVPTVLGELRRHFRDQTWSVRVPRRLQELRMQIAAAQTELRHTLSRSPTAADVAAHLKISEEDVLEGLEGARAYAATSLSAPATASGDARLGDMLGGEDAGFGLTELRVALGPAIATLDEREKNLLALRFYDNLTQSQIAERVGLSQMHVSRLLARALGKLHRELFGEDVVQHAPPRRRRRACDT